jgi:hypothetical protein
MGCGVSVEKYSAAEVLQAYDTVGPQCPRINMESPNVAVWEGKGWIFNEAPPIEPALVKRIEACMSKVEMTYADVFKVIKDAYIDCLGDDRWPKQMTNETRAILLKANKDKVCAYLDGLNQKCADAGAGVSFEADEGERVKTLIGVGAKMRGGEVKGMKNQHQSHTVCYVYMIFTDEQGAEGNAPQDAAHTPGTVPPAQTPAQKIKDLKDLMDMGAITQEEFEEKKTAILASM